VARFHLSSVDIDGLAGISASDPLSMLPDPSDTASRPFFNVPAHWVDCEGEPIKRYPIRYRGTPEEWYESLRTLKPHQCGWPDGRTLNGAGTRICKRAKTEGAARCQRHLGSRGRGLTRMEGEGCGRWSKYLPKGYWQIYEQVHADPNLLQIRQDVELIAIRQTELAKQLHSGESGSLWKELREAWAAVKAASAAGDSQRLAAALQVVGKVIGAGNKKEKLWKDILNVTDRVVTLKRAEHQRLKELHEMLTVERFLTVLAGYHELVLEVTPEKERRVRLARRLQAIIAGGMGTPAAGGGGEEEGGEAEQREDGGDEEVADLFGGEDDE
jgi:hypothetical protein